MRLIKQKTEFGTNIVLNEEDKYLTISFGGNFDLYWSIHYKHPVAKDDNTLNNFVITKENYGLYRLFENLFNDIENINLYDDEDYIPLYLETEKEVAEYFKEQRKNREEDKKNINYLIIQIIMNYLMKNREL